MSRKLVTIQKIKNIRPIEGADRLEVCNILGWQCVIEKGKYKEDELVYYFEVDSWIPEMKELDFLRKTCWRENENGKGYRIRTIRLKGQISQGLVLPLNFFGTIDEYKEGEDVTELLGVKVYNPPIPACLKGMIKGSFPSFIPKTDETRVQLLQDVLTRHKGALCYVTEKVDGTSITCYLKDGEFGVCSRNLEMKEGEDAYWTVVKELDVENKLRKFVSSTSRIKFNIKNIAIQGELIGVGIQGNPLQLDKKTILWFNVFDIDKYEYLSFYSVFELIRNDLNLETVPEIYAGWELIDNIDVIVRLATRKSKLNPNKQAEGIVIRPVVERIDMQMSQGFGNGRLSFKCINPEYLLTNDN